MRAAHPPVVPRWQSAFGAARAVRRGDGRESSTYAQTPVRRITCSAACTIAKARARRVDRSVDIGDIVSGGGGGHPLAPPAPAASSQSLDEAARRGVSHRPAAHEGERRSIAAGGVGGAPSPHIAAGRVWERQGQGWGGCTAARPREGWVRGSEAKGRVGARQRHTRRAGLKSRGRAAVGSPNRWQRRRG